MGYEAVLDSLDAKMVERGAAKGDYRRAFEAGVDVFQNQLVFRIVKGSFRNGGLQFALDTMARAVDPTLNVDPSSPPPRGLEDRATEVALGLCDGAPPFASLVAPTATTRPLDQEPPGAHIDFEKHPVERCGGPALANWLAARGHGVAADVPVAEIRERVQKVLEYPEDHPVRVRELRVPFPRATLHPVHLSLPS